MFSATLNHTVPRLPRYFRTVALFSLAVFSGRSSAAVSVGDLRTEYAVNPIGIDTLVPRLSWVITDPERGQLQRAYQVVVSDPFERLVWDSGKVISDRSANVDYGGPPLHSGEKHIWKVRIWDKTDSPSPWSASAHWQIALLNPGDWKAKWIGQKDPGIPAWRDFEFSAELTLASGGGSVLFRALDSDNGYLWEIVPDKSHGLVLHPKQVRNGTVSALPPGTVEPPPLSGDLTKHHRLKIIAQQKQIQTWIDGEKVDERREDFFAAGAIGFRAEKDVRLSVAAVRIRDLESGISHEESFDGYPALFPSAYLENKEMVVASGTIIQRPVLPKTCPRLIKPFAVTQPVQTAIVSICGLGFYELYLNGAKADRSVLSGANSRYDRKVFFDTLDVTSRLKLGNNVIGVWLAPGYSDDFNFYGWKWEFPKRARVQLDITYRDGSKQTVVSDQSWRCLESPIRYTSLYHGEMYDARREDAPWAAAGAKYDAAQTVAELEDLQVPLLPNQAARLEVAAELKPIAVTEPKPGVFVFDLGQAFAGWIKLRAKGSRGTTVRMHHSELLGADGMIDPWTNRLARALDTFVLCGIGREEFEPHFTYHGFRYVEVTGYPGKPTLDDVVGCVLRSAMPPAVTFVSSDPLLNQIESNCVWSMGSNLLSVPTDCCMRDERTPCLMDSLAYEDSALVHFQANGFYNQWLKHIAGERGNPDWHGDAVMLPWRLYREYGDVRALENNYENMKGVVDDMAAKTPDRLFKTGYGDWCAPSDGTSFLHCFSSVTEVNTSLFAEEAKALGRVAARLGKTDDAKAYRALSENIAGALNTHDFDPTRSVYGNGAQATALLPLAFNLVPPERKAAVLAQLVTTIKTVDKNHLNTGIFGTRYLLDVLCDNGQEDLALAMLHEPGYPGFAYQIEMGATTLWEQWRYRGVMNSHNHAMFAGISSSFVTRLAGITPAEPGYTLISLRPYFPKNLARVECTQATLKGKIGVRWERLGQQITLDLTIPGNTRARLALPVDDPMQVTESGRPFVQEAGIADAGREDGRQVFLIGSGTYHLVIPVSR